jgi:hypothetical protein
MNVWIFLALMLAIILGSATLIYLWLGVPGVGGVVLVAFIIWRLWKGEAI